MSKDIPKSTRYKGKRHPKKKKLNRNKDICLNPNKRRYDSWHHANKDAMKRAKQTGIKLRVHSCGKHFHITKRN